MYTNYTTTTTTTTTIINCIIIIFLFLESRLNQLNNPLLQNINVFYNANKKTEEINFNFKKSNKYEYKKNDKKEFADYQYCVMVEHTAKKDVFIFKNLIFEKLELFFEIKKSPRSFKTIDYNESIHIYFQNEVKLNNL